MDIEYLLEQLYSLLHVPIALYSSEGKQQRLLPDSEVYSSLLEIALEQLLQMTERAEYAAFDDFIMFGFIRLDDGRKVALGPVLHKPGAFDEAVRICCLIRGSRLAPKEISTFFAEYSRESVFWMSNLIGIVYYLLTGEKMKISSLLVNEPNEAHDELHDSRNDLNIYHNTEQVERQLMSYIETGQSGKLASFYENVPYVGKTGVLAEDSLRSLKNLFIAMVTLSSRAAVRGGLDYDLAMSISDTYIIEIESCVEMRQILFMMSKVMIEYATLVKKCRQKAPDSAIALRVSNYVLRNIDKKISGEDIAGHMGIDRSYLCRCFKKDTGQTLHDYIVEVKMEEACRLLKTTQVSILDIAMLLDYSSQSNFQTAFKKHCGVTPTQYRNTGADEADSL